MRSIRKLSLASLAAVMVMALTVAPGASARRQSVSSQIVVSSLTANGASGSVIARKTCRAGRKVTLYQEQTVTGRPAGVPIAQTTTTKSGIWGIPMLLPSGQYFARVSRGHTKRFTCRASASLPQDTG